MGYFVTEGAGDVDASSACSGANLAQARRLFESFAGFAPPCVTRARVELRIPSVLVDLGALRGVVYTKDHGRARRTYIHFMEDPPRLLCDAGGRRLYVHGGSYRVTQRGIEG
ncbi:MAG TPA: hypothetical protein VMN56_02555 [Casimicrobiaceae bacterium]|nr:hypothetical protein [Casimicrobiaceae bacterium]